MAELLKMGEPGWTQQELSREYTRQALRIAEQLRDTAERIERMAARVPTDLSTGLPDHNRAVIGVLGAIDTFHGNLSTSILLIAAADADRHARNPEEGS